MTDTVRALLLDGPCAGRIQEMPRAGWVNVERADGVRRTDVFAEYTQVLYRPTRVELFDRMVWVASRRPGVSTEDLVRFLLSDTAKDLIGIDTAAPTA